MATEIVRELVAGEWVTKVGSGGGGAGSITEITSTDASFTIVDPTGPVVDLSAPGGVAVLEDPGVAWQPDHVYAEGDRFAETLEGELRVFEITVAGTSGSGSFSDYGYDLVPLADWGTNSETFIYIGIVGQLDWTIAPFLGGGLAVGPNQGTGHELAYTSAAEPEDSENLFTLRATVATVPVDVFLVNTDGDGDHFLNENTGAGFRWWASVGGVDTSIAEVTYEHFKTFAGAKVGFYGAVPAAKPTGVAVTAEAIHAALVTLGLIAGP